MNYVPTVRRICGVKREHPRLEHTKLMKNLLRQSNFFDLVTLLLIRGIQMGEMAKLGWLMGFANHAIWAISMYFLYLLFLSISKVLTSF
jgi:membrane protein CcdC involved in cytochrome C biogenesis